MSHAPKPYPHNLRVLIVAGEPHVRESLAAVLRLAGGCGQGATIGAAQPGIEIVGEAESGQAALNQVRSLQPDVVLIDLEMPGLDGYAAAGSLKRSYPSLRVIALSLDNGPEARRQAGLAGVDGLVEKGAPLADLLAALYARP